MNKSISLSSEKELNIPTEIVREIEQELSKIQHGSVQLEVTLRDGVISRFRISTDKSILASDYAGRKINE